MKLRLRHSAIAASLLGVVVAGTLAASTGLASATPSGGRATVTISSASTAEGQILVLGSGPYAGASLYYLTSDSPSSFTCTPTVVTVIGHSIACTQEWPPILTDGHTAPIAGSGVNAALLGSVWRSDLDARQVTFAGHPLYAFNPQPGNVSGDNFDEATVPPWHGAWYLLNASTGLAAPKGIKVGLVQLASGRTVLGATMGTLLGGLTFPIYTDSADTSSVISCTGACAVEFPPLLTSGTVVKDAGSGIKTGSLGTVIRPDGTIQVTYEGKPVYLYSNEGVDFSSGTPVFAGSGNHVAPVTGGAFQLITG